MATISSSQKLANTQPPTLSATQESSAEGEGLFASLFGGVVLEDASETKSADMADEASRPASGDGDAEREDVAGIIIAEDGDASEAEDDVSTTLLAGIGATAIVTHTADDSTKDSMPQDGTAEKDAQRQSPTPSLLSEAQRDGRIVAKQLEMAARTARQPANQDDSARSKQPAMQLAGQMTGKSGKTTAMQSGNQLQQTVIGAERQASKIA
ncbi:MAG: hypothetical protein ACPIC4_09975, partial [Candidatus Puniceispirillaceae bacterium]